MRQAFIPAILSAAVLAKDFKFEKPDISTILKKEDGVGPDNGITLEFTNDNAISPFTFEYYDQLNTSFASTGRS